MMSNYQIIEGNALEALGSIEDGVVHTCITSPPYFGLRDYGHGGQIGLESHPDEYVAKLVSVFRTVRDKLRPDGTLWLNLGDSYANSSNGSNPSATSYLGGCPGNASKYRDSCKYASKKIPAGLKPKDLMGIPWRVAFALQADGWYLRQDIIWHKPNPMPESVKDRCTKAHEYIFLFAKSDRYYWDKQAMQEPTTDPEYRTKGKIRKTKFDMPGFEIRGGLHNQTGGRLTRNRRIVWTVTTKPFKGSHFATFPPDLIEPCILAGAPEGGVVLDPFGGSGTTAMVALKHRRRAILCEINPAYVAMAHERILKSMDTKGHK